MGKRFLSFFTAFVILSAFAFYPLHVLAAEPDDFAVEFLQNYKSLGTDEEGNVILSEDDYEMYMNDVLAYVEKNSADVSDSETLTKSQTRALKASAPVKASSTSDLVLDEVKEKSRFLDLPVFNNFVVDAVKWMITECLSNPIHAGEVLPEEPETESETETETEPTPPTTSTEVIPAVAGLGSNLQKYTINGNELYERIDVAMNAKIASTYQDSDIKITVTRSGLGASSSSEMEYEPEKQIRVPNVYWRSGSFTSETLGFPAGTMYAGYGVSVYSMKYTLLNGNTSYGGANPKFYNFSVNQLPVITRSGSTVVQLSSIMNGDNVAVFAENSFYSNNPTYISNHTLNATTNNYWNSYNVSVENTNSYITSSTTINTTNYNDYSQYGYYVDNSGGLAIDDVTLNNYIQNVLLAGLLQGYIDAYVNFPEVGVTVDDPDIQYVNPFDTGEEPTQSESSGGTGNITIDADGNVYIDGTIADLQIIASAGAGIYIEGANITINQTGDNITNNYYYYTDPVEPSATTTTTIILPPDTSSEAATYPPIIPDAEPKYTLDMSAVYSDMSYIKQQSNQISVTRSLWVVSLLDKILQDTQLLPLFLFLFLMSVLGVLLWK